MIIIHVLVVLGISPLGFKRISTVTIMYWLYSVNVYTTLYIQRCDRNKVLFYSIFADNEWYSSLLLTYPPLHFVVCRLGSWHANVFGLLPSQSSSGFCPYPLTPGSRHLRFGMPRFPFSSTAICNIILVASSLSRLCTCPNHLNPFSLNMSKRIYSKC